MIPIEKIKKAAKVDSDKQTKYDNAHDRKKGFLEGVKWAQKQAKLSTIPDVNINLERAKKYARHQHFLGTQQKDLVEFDDWKHVDLLTFEQWYELNESEINIELAENGADRELDFDSEREFEKRYEKYCSLL